MGTVANAKEILEKWWEIAKDDENVSVMNKRLDTKMSSGNFVAFCWQKPWKLREIVAQVTAQFESISTTKIVWKWLYFGKNWAPSTSAKTWPAKTVEITWNSHHFLRRKRGHVHPPAQKSPWTPSTSAKTWLAKTVEITWNRHRFHVQQAFCWQKNPGNYVKSSSKCVYVPLTTQFGSISNPQFSH